MKKNIIFICLIFVVLLLVGCATKSKITDFTIVLDENPTTGYVWTCSSSDEKVAVATLGDYQMKQAEPGMVGVGGKRFITVNPVGPGSAVITCSLARSWEPDPIETVSYYVVVDKFNNIKIEIMSN